MRVVRLVVDLEETFLLQATNQERETELVLLIEKVLFDVVVIFFIFTYFYKLADLNQLDITMTDLSGADLRGSKLRLASLNGEN